MTDDETIAHLEAMSVFHDFKVERNGSDFILSAGGSGGYGRSLPEACANHKRNYDLRRSNRVINKLLS